MLVDDIYLRIKKTLEPHLIQITHHDILSALTEELGEYSRAVRIEDDAKLCHNKVLKESSRIEIVDLILVAMEAYIFRGGTIEEMEEIVDMKLTKWEKLWSETHVR